MGRLAALAAATVLVLAACGGGDGGDGGGTGPVRPERGGDLTLVSVNILHGIFCPAETEGCRAADRLDLFLDRLEPSCPDLVAFQEIDTRMLELVQARARDLCEGAYETVWHGTGGVDRELVLSALPVVDSELRILTGGLRSAFWVRVESGLGPVDLVVTHLASADNPPCDAGGDTRTCQATEVADFLAERRAGDGVAIVAGDLNDTTGSPPLEVLSRRGLLDSHLEAGNAECDPATGEQCTSGRADRDLTDLVDPSSRQTERIDYVLVAPPEGCDPAWDTGRDADGDGVPSGLFHPEPADPPHPAGIVFPSDHTAVALDLACG